MKAANHLCLSSAAQLRASGFSLIELLVVLAIAAVLLGIGVPNMQQYIVSSRLSGASNDFFSALNVARSEAVRRGVQVTLATNGSAGSRDFTSGWTMFVDTNADGALTAGEEVLRVGAALDAPMTIFGSANFGSFIAFDATGRLTTGGGSFVICHGTSLVVDGIARARAVVINSAGRVRAGVMNSANVPVTDTGAVPSCNNT
ncbi:MAG TPA: GspH/FimT family pseudopilin [Burkholderiaceae bacterium]|nr:GspH/FimT family pseudopilin [Burkholderiaceae bacterium]